MSQVPKRHLGKDGPLVSAIGFGAMGLSDYYGTVPPNEERFKVLDRALELGSTFWDTSDVCVSLLVRTFESSYLFLIQMQTTRICLSSGLSELGNGTRYFWQQSLP